MPPETGSRPYVIMNMAMSADGKISTSRRESFALGTRDDRYLMDVLRARADAVVVGAGTVRVDGWAILVRDKALREKRATRRGPHPLNVILSTRLDLPTSRSIFTHPRTKKLFITTKAAPEARRRRFGRIGEVVVLPGRQVSPRRVLALLAGRGMRTVLLEGGGELNFAFFRERLVNEIFVTVTPRVLGGAEAPTVVDGRGFTRDDHVHLELVSARRRGDEVFLRYRVRGG